MKKIIFTLFITTLIFPLSYAQSQNMPECPFMDGRVLIDKINSGEKLFIVDLRSPQEYEAGHIPGAISMPGKSSRDRLPVEINKDDKVVTVSVDGKFAKIVCRNVIANKHPVAYSLKGGMNSWNGPVEK